MPKLKLKIIYIISLVVIPVIHSFAQTSISGKLTDAATNQPLAGVNIYVKDTYVGTVSDANGYYELKTSLSPPLRLIFSMIGYKNIERTIDGDISNLDISMEEEILLGQEIVVAASRFEENILVSPVSVEKIGIRDIERSTSANFYDGLYNMKGVDMNVQSLTFKLPNTRGFNNTTNYRFNQIVDGMDNTPPGLSFAAGNILGLSQIDVESVEMLVGASSALYGPGGMNGTLLMTSQNPFDYQGLKMSLQSGLMHFGNDYGSNVSPMIDFNMRYAKSFNDNFAFKVVGGYLRAQDWYAADYRDRNDLNNPNSTRDKNPGYDGVNVYGDDIIVPVNLRDIAPGVAAGVAENIGLVPGSPEFTNFVDSLSALFPDQVVTRTGWNEEHLVDYGTRNFRLTTSLNYRFSDSWEAILYGGYARGTAVYTAQNRFSLKDFGSITWRAEIKNPNFYLRAWGIKENAGKTYDAGTTGLLMNEAWKPSEEWYTDYVQSFTTNFLLRNPLEQAHTLARIVADNRWSNGDVFDDTKPAFPLPGTDEFNTLFNDITGRSLGDGGTLVIDHTSMTNIEGMYDFRELISLFDIVIGFNYRHYTIDTEGTAFFDTPGNPIYTYQAGAFAQVARNALANKLKFTFSARWDKHEKFEGRVTPRFSFVYSLDPFRKHNLRASIQSAFRFPSTPDQWLDLDVGRFKVIGGLPEVHAKYGIDTTNVFPLTGPNPITDETYLDEGPLDLPPFRPEEMQAFEFGYRGLYMQDNLFVDAYIYQNRYDGFHATQLLVQFPYTPQEQRYQTTISTNSNVSATGWAIGTEYQAGKGYGISGNIAWNKLESTELQEGLQTEYNTPDYRLNLGFSKRNLLPDLSFNLNWRWQNEFLWESKFGVAEIPAYSSLDFSFDYKVKNLKSFIKVGASNALNSYYTTGFGNAQVGGLYYITWTYDQFMN
jgi:hypothetical protein